MAIFKLTRILDALGALINPATYDAQTDGSQQTQIVDGSGNVVGTEQSVNGNYHLNVSMQQDVLSIAENSSATNLLAGATFTGTGVSTLGVNSIQVTLKTDQNCYVYIDQSPTAPPSATWDISDRYYYNKIANNFSRTIQAVNSYFRVRVVNLNSTTDTTYFRLQSVLCPMANPVNRSPNEDGYPQTAIFGFNDTHGEECHVTPSHALVTIEPKRLVGSTISGSTVDTNFWTLTASGTGATAAQSNGLITLTTGTTNGYAQMASVRIARFVFGIPNRFRTVLRIPDLTETGNIRRWGAATVSTSTPQDGAYFELSETGVLSVVTCAGATPSAVSSGSFNGTVSEYVLDTNVHQYEIVYWTQNVSFYIDDILVHKVTPTTALPSLSWHLPILISAVGPTAGAEPAQIQVWNAAIYRLGSVLSSPQAGRISGNAATYTFKLGPGVLQKLIFNNTTGTSVTIYDNTTAAGTPRSVITTTTACIGVWDMDLPFFVGLVIVTAGNGLDATVVYE